MGVESIGQQDMYDVIFLHPPVSRGISLLSRMLYGKPKKLVEFPLVPMGLFSMASLLQSQGFECAILNLGLEKMRNPSLNLGRYIDSLSSKIFAVDLHWFTHCDGAIYIAHLCKKSHPDSIVVLGGYTATFFDEQILRKYRHVDFIVRGEGETVILDLVKAISESGDVSNIDGLSYSSKSHIERNPLQPPNSIDRFEYTRLELMKDWEEYLKCHSSSMVSKPSFWLTIARGCLYDCAYCGGSRSCYRLISGREDPVLRDPERIAEDIDLLVNKYGVKVVRLSHDPQIFGVKFWSNFFRDVKERGVDVSAYWESFRLPSESLIEEAKKTFASLNMAISPESAMDEVRAGVGRAFSNEDMSKALEFLQENDVLTDVFFLVGLPGENEKTIDRMIRLAQRILARNKNAFVQPPFPYTIDPNCLMAINPKKYGIRPIFKEFEDYRDMCTRLGWQRWVGHETNLLSRTAIAQLTKRVHDIFMEFYRKDFVENFARRSAFDS